MIGKQITMLAAALGFALLGTASGWANSLDSANVNLTCSGYTVAVSGDSLQSDQYAVTYTIGLQGPGGSTITATGSIPVQSMDSHGDFNTSIFNNWSPPLASGSYSVQWGDATLVDLTKKSNFNTIYMHLTPMSFSCAPCCTVKSSNGANFNATAVSSGYYIWFNSNFSAKGVPSTGATLNFTNSTISFTANGVAYTLPAPNALVTFSPSVTCATTTFDAATNTWLTTLPVQGSDEIFLSGLSFPVPKSFGKVTGQVVWSGTFSSTTPGVQAQWKWGAAAYSQFTTQYNSLMVKPSHSGACGAQFNNGDHAGAPEGQGPGGLPWSNWVVGGGTGGGGSNVTGSWSGTVSAVPNCPAH